ncbi:hypothetical protein TRAPUB_2304 [Trametes pubescens]|uniref:Uncharacterized protein n=1 Tax=Trametes pubescens TaxID=154538 RepID=A0A1M2VGX6_TRAPU|nr:hypothetical protein TRAPUB_2304 [Trametes pubescens]
MPRAHAVSTDVHGAPFSGACKQASSRRSASTNAPEQRTIPLTGAADMPVPDDVLLALISLYTYDARLPRREVVNSARPPWAMADCLWHVVERQAADSGASG